MLNSICRPDTKNDISRTCAAREIDNGEAVRRVIHNEFG